MTDQRTKSNVGIHFFYVTLILVALIIFIATARWTELPKFTDYLSAAATITSLVLGLLAIIYAYISNDSLSQTTGVLSGAAGEAQQATSKITLLVDNVENLTRGTTQTNEKLAVILYDLKEQLNSLDGTAATLDKQVNAIVEVLPEIPKGLQKMEKRFDEFIQAAPIADPIPIKAISPETLEKFAENCVASSSPAGVLLIHAIYLSHKNDKEIDIKKFTKFSSPDYLFGYFIAMNSLGLVEYEKANGTSTSLVKITFCPDAFSEARSAFEAKSNKQKSEETKNRWKLLLEQVEEQFGES